MISFRRLYHVSSVTYSVKKLGIKLCKMVNPTSKKQWYPMQSLDDTLPTVKSLTKSKREPGKQSLRRMAMLNKIFMKQITDMMSTGTVSMAVVGRGIEISKVKVTPDFQTVNVFWICKGTASDSEIEAVLNKTAGALRHELSVLRVMGEIPYVVFVKDKLEARVADLNRRLAIADYGDDYVLTEEGHLLKSEFVLNTKLSPEVQAKIKQLEQDLPIDEEPIPEMTHTVFGLDHAKIINRLLAARKKSHDAWVNFDTDNEVISYRAPATMTSDPDTVSQKKELAEFLLQRQILNKKIAKEKKNIREDRKILMSLDDDPDAEPKEAFYDEFEELDEDDDEYYRSDFGYEPEYEKEKDEKPTSDVIDSN